MNNLWTYIAKKLHNFQIYTYVPPSASPPYAVLQLEDVVFDNTLPDEHRRQHIQGKLTMWTQSKSVHESWRLAQEVKQALSHEDPKVRILCSGLSFSSHPKFKGEDLQEGQWTINIFVRGDIS